MRRAFVLASVATAAAAVALLPPAARGHAVSPLAGVWTLNRSLSELPREIGFNVAGSSSSSGADQSGDSGGGGRRRRGSGRGGGARGSAGPVSAPRESDEDARRLQLMTADARNPSVRLMIVDTAAAVTITNELGQSWTLHPNGTEESIERQGVPILATARRDGDRLAVVYHVAQGREVQYTYSHATSPSQLIVEVQFLEHGTGDKARLVYEPGAGTGTAAAPAGAAAPPSIPRQARETFDERPGAELKGITSLGILVEDLSAQAVACGLNHDGLEAAVAKRLTDGGFVVHRNSDEDTYLYVNVMTSTLPGGTCVSRYDAFLYTHATANLSYRDRPVLVQVSLLHRGGMGAGAPAAHAAAVTRGLESHVDLFVTQIHDANK